MANAKPKRRPTADQWARDWYAPRGGVGDTPMFEYLGLGPLPMMPGMPSFPDVVTEAGVGWVNRAEFMDHSERLLRDGWGIALVVALRLHCALSPADPMPGWMAEATSNLLFLWHTGRAETLDDALGIGRARGQLKRRKRVADFGAAIRADIDVAQLHNVAIGDELFELIAERYSVPVNLVREVYRSEVSRRRLRKKT